MYPPCIEQASVTYLLVILQGPPGPAGVKGDTVSFLLDLSLNVLLTYFHSLYTGTIKQYFHICCFKVRETNWPVSLGAIV